MDWEMQDLLSKADRALGRLDGITEILPNPDLFVAMYIKQEAVLSSQIEGTQASLIDVLEFESELAKSTPSDKKDIYEVINYVSAFNYVLERLKTLPMSLRLLKEIHARLLQNVRGAERDPGQFRKSQNWIGHAGGLLSDAAFVPPTVDEMNRSMGDLELFLYDESLRLPVLIKVGLVHGQFETIHPFLDGNGRMGRLLITFLLCNWGILQHPLLYLSYYFKKNRQQYYERLQGVRDRDQWEEWLKFFLNGVYSVSQEATKKAREIVRMREQHREIASGMGNRALPLLEYLYQSPVINVRRLAQEDGIPYSTLNKTVAAFEDAGLLVNTSKTQRNRIYSYKQYLDLFQDI
jgi:Fic family protein